MNRSDVKLKEAVQAMKNDSPAEAIVFLKQANIYAKLELESLRKKFKQ